MGIKYSRKQYRKFLPRPHILTHATVDTYLTQKETQAVRARLVREKSRRLFPVLVPGVRV